MLRTHSLFPNISSPEHSELVRRNLCLFTFSISFFVMTMQTIFSKFSRRSKAVQDVKATSDV